ncbi:MAG: MFS transporter [Gammaproteobacteria bacterium]|nr:MFS transporter [Gammaproteobacteria bacterium]
MGIPRWFYGWTIVGAVFTILFLIFSAAYTFSAVFPSLSAEFDASRASVSLIFSIAAFLYFGLGAISGPLGDRIEPKWVVGFGVVVIAAGLVVAATAERLWQVYAGYGIGIGVGVGFAYVPAVSALQRWFNVRRGFASGLAIAGIGVGTLCAPPAAAVLIEWSGWRATYLLLAIAVLIVGLGASALLESAPQQRGLQPDGAPSGPGSRPTMDGASPREALTSRTFWLMYVATVFVSLGLFVPFVHLVPFALDNGMTARTGAILIGAIGVGSTFGRFLIGGLADRHGRMRVFVGCFAGLGAMSLIWFATVNPWVLGAFALGFGLFYGGWVALAPAVLADYFGVRSLGSIIGALYSSVGIGTLFGPPLAGYAFDTWQSYDVPILVGAVTGFIGAAIASMIPHPNGPAEKHSANRAT